MPLTVFLAEIGGHEVAQHYLADMQSVADDSDLTFFARAIAMRARSDPEHADTKEFNDLVDRWMAANPGSRFALQQKAGSLASAAQDAAREENLKQARQLRTEAIDLYVRSLSRYLQKDGTYSYFQIDGYALVHLGITLAEHGQKEQANKILDAVLLQLQDKHATRRHYLHIATIHAYRGDYDAALHELDAAYDVGWYSVWTFENYTHNWFPELKNNVRYQQIINRVKQRNAKTLAHVLVREAELSEE
ncbi:MAG: hypothetical protein JKY88_17925 [Pseudomonadales bacterium]|nr:hypothetical protein [Pseudomonadales bacterium]